MRSDSDSRFFYHVLWRETRDNLERYRERVSTGVDLDGALAFAKFVLWSGLPRVLAPYDNQGIWKVDSAHLGWLAKELQRDVQERYRKGKTQPDAPLTQLEAIHHKLDLLAGHVSQLAKPLLICSDFSSLRTTRPRERDAKRRAPGR